MISLRNKFADTIYELAKEDDRICVIVADISPAGSIQKFREEFPDRFINVGVSEQIMIGMAAGMAQRGMRVFCYTIATFALYRPFEFIRNDLAYQNLPVTVVGIGGGLTYSTLGATHHAMEDIAVACAIPNMRVIAPCDPAETEAATRWCAQNNEGPVYLRLGKAGEPDLTKHALPWKYGKLRTVEGRWIKGKRGVCVLAYGPMVGAALEMGRRSIEEPYSVVSVSTLKPLDVGGIVEILKTYDEVTVIEEMVQHGGLGDRVRAITSRLTVRPPITTMFLRDAFSHTYGTHEDLIESQLWTYSERGCNA